MTTAVVLLALPAAFALRIWAGVVFARAMDSDPELRAHMERHMRRGAMYC